jgi:Gluconate 2-dehydrogenase subunit 3
MRRRDFVKGILAASAAAKTMAAQQAAPAAPAASAAQHTLPPPTPIAPGPVPWMRGLMDVKPLEMGTLVPDAVAQTEAHFFNEQQTKTLRRLCALLMPPLKGRPGALDAGAPEFLDFLIGVSPRDRKQMYLSGLDRLDVEAKNRFDGSFAATTDVQADELIRLWLRAWMTDHPPTEPFARFINLAHSDIRMATINSQAWSEAVRAEGRGAAGVDLYWYPVDPDMHRGAEASAQRAEAGERRG